MSITLTSLAVLVLNYFLPDVSQTDLETTVRTLVSLFSILGIYFGRVRVGDVTWYGKRV